MNKLAETRRTVQSEVDTQKDEDKSETQDKIGGKNFNKFSRQMSLLLFKETIEEDSKKPEKDKDRNQLAYS